MSWCRGAGRCHGHLSTLRASASRRARGERRPVRHTSKGQNQMTHHWLPSRKHPKNDGTSSFSMGKSTISMAIFNSYLDITRGYHWFDWWSCGAAFEVDGLRARQCPRYIPIAPWQGSLPEGELGDRTGIFVFFFWPACFANVLNVPGLSWSTEAVTFVEFPQKLALVASSTKNVDKKAAVQIVGCWQTLKATRELRLVDQQSSKRLACQLAE